MSASTEAYFAFLDTQWREVAVKHPKLTPKQIQAQHIAGLSELLAANHSAHLDQVAPKRASVKGETSVMVVALAMC